MTLSSNNVLEELVLSFLEPLDGEASFLLLMDGELKNGCSECFSGLNVGAYISHRLSFKSFVFVNSSVEEVCNLDSLMVFVSLFNELCDLSPGCVPEGEDVVDESFPDERPVKPLSFKIFVSTLAMKI